MGLVVRGGARVVNSGVHGGGSGSLFPFLVEGQQRHVCHLHDLLLKPLASKELHAQQQPRQKPPNNLRNNPFVATPKKPLLPLRVLRNLWTSLNVAGLARTDLTPRPDWAGSHGLTLPGRGFGPYRETPPTLPRGFVLVQVSR